MSDLVIAVFVFTVLYFILSSSSASFAPGWGQIKSCFQTRQDRQLADASRWDNIGGKNTPPKLPSMYLEGLEPDRQTVDVEGAPSLITKIATEATVEDDYGDEPLNDRFNSVLKSSTKYSDSDLLRMILMRTNELPEEEQVYAEDIRLMEEQEYDLGGRDINNRIAFKVKKNNQKAKQNTNCKIPLSAIRDDMELDYAGLEDNEPWWTEKQTIFSLDY